MDVALVAGDTADAAKALGRFARDVEGHSGDAAAEVAEAVVKAAKGNVGNTGGTHPRSPNAIVFRRKQGEGGSVALDYGSAPWIVGAEYGASRAWVFGNVTLQSRLSRRQFGTHVRDDFGGYMVGRAWRTVGDRETSKAADDVFDELGADLDRAGIRKV